MKRFFFISCVFCGLLGNLFAPRTESGLLLGEFAYMKAGTAPQTLVIFPPLFDALYNVQEMPDMYRGFLRDFSKEYTVYVISRRKNLPDGYTIPDMAKDYAEVFERVTGPAHLLGLSMGGLIAEQFALHYPQYAQSLILGVSARRVSPFALEAGTRWKEWARKKKWTKMFHDMNDKTYTGLNRLWYKFFAIPIGGIFVKKPRHPYDFIVSMEAVRSNHLDDEISTIKIPTLIIGGKLDLLFPEEVLIEEAKKIPNAKWVILEGTGHGAYLEKKRLFNRTVLNFLRQTDALRRQSK